MSAKDIDENKDGRSDYFEWNLIPNNASEDNKTGASFRGSDEEYLIAHGKILEMTSKKGERYSMG